jgi:DNA-binding transcriptional regulator YiaG
VWVEGERVGLPPPQRQSDGILAEGEQESATGLVVAGNRDRNLVAHWSIREVYYPTMTGAQLKRLRARLGVTQERLADQLGVHWNTLARWERDELPIRPPIERLLLNIDTATGKNLRQRRKAL